MGHHSYWHATAQVPSLSSATGKMEVDVAIVGAGVCGLTAALLLARQGLRVAVLERQPMGSGATAHSTGHLTALVDSHYHKLVRSFGIEGIRLVRESMEAAIDQVETITKQHRIDCSFARVPAYYYSEQGGLEKLHFESAVAEQAGLSVARTQEVPLPFRTAGGVRVEGQARFHPAAYLFGLAQAATAAGAAVYTSTPALHIADGEPCRVETPVGVVQARDVIMATHTPVGVSLLHTLLVPLRSYVLAARLDGPAVSDALFWDTAEPYHYIRQQPANDATWLIVGGYDHKTGHGHPDTAHRALDDYLRSRFDAAKVHQRWSAQYYMPVDGLPYIGRGPGMGHVYVGTGFLGDGLTFGSLAGMMLADMVTGRSNAYAELYKPARIKLGGVKNFVSNSACVAKDFLADRVMTGSSLESLEPGEARSARAGLKPVAGYRDEEGVLHEHSAVCSHLKCIVHWNGAEHSWDCPCHGSRFNVDGQPVEGPATRPLKD